MKLVLLIVAIVTPLCVWAGYRTGSEVTQDPIIEPILANTQIKELGSNEYVLNFSCHGQALASFDVDKNKLISEKMTDDQIAKVWKRHIGAYQRIYDSVLGFAAGGGLMKYAKPALSFFKAKQNSKYTIPAMIGGLSGFYLGYELAVRNQFDCSDLVVVRFSQKDDIWREIVKPSIARRYLLQVIGSSGSSADLDSTELKEIHQAIADNKIDSKTFVKLETFESYIQPTQSPVSWFSFDLIIGLWIPVAMLIAAAVVSGILLSELLARRIRARRGKAAAS